MAKITITEGLQEIKTVIKRVEKKQLFIRNNVTRQANLKDSLAKGGETGKEVLAQERQAIDDLTDRAIRIRQAISKANDNTEITVAGKTRSVAEWLIWRREHADNRQSLLDNLNSHIQQARAKAGQRGGTLAESEYRAKDNDIIVNVDEKELADEIEEHEKIVGTLDGKLSLVNATTTIDVEEEAEPKKED